MKRWTRFCCFVVAMLMLFSAIPQVRAEEALEQNASVDFVVVMDFSNSMFELDPDRLCLNAFQTFIDQLPVENARVGVIGFGYDGPDYPYSSKYTSDKASPLYMKTDAPGVHQILPLTASNGASRETLKREVQNAADDAYKEIRNVLSRKGTLVSPVIPALAAAVDMLEKGGAKANQAGIILVTDGVPYTRAGIYDYRPVAEEAKKSGWPVYAIELNYANPDRGEVKAAQELLDNICAASGDRLVGRESCAKPVDVYSAFMRIFWDMWKYPQPLPEPWPIPVNIPGDFSFEVPLLTSEATVTLFGSGMKSVTLEDPDGKQYDISRSYTSDNLVAVVQSDKYISLKLILPKDGTWVCHIKGKGDAVLAVNMNLQEMGLTAVGNPAGDRDFEKQETIRVDACFSYQGREVHNRDVYQKMVDSVKLVVNHSGGAQKVYPMKENEQGFYCDLMLNDFPCGDLTIQVVMEDNMYRSGIRGSNPLTYTTVAKPVELTGAGPTSLEGYVNSDFRIDLSQILRNPDGDPVTYSLTCGDSKFVCAPTVEGDFMTIPTGLVPGVFKVELSAKDVDMTQPVKHSMTLTVVDREMILKKTGKVELWLDWYPFQKKAAKEHAALDLSEYVEDPDGVALTYRTESENPDLVQTSIQGDVLTLTPQAVGKTTLKVFAFDGVGEAELNFKVECVSGKAEFWKDNWIYFALAAAALILLVLVVIFLVKNKRVKGTWEVTVDHYGSVGIIDNIDIAGYTGVGKKGRFLLRDLIQELLPFTNPAIDAVGVMGFFSGTGAEKIQLVGVNGRKGCGVKKIPNTVTVSVNGVPAKKSAKIAGGQLTFLIDQGGQRLTIHMRLK